MDADPNKKLVRRREYVKSKVYVADFLINYI